MITKLTKIKDSWIIKILLILTALSFVSLFGITGYIGNAGQNDPVVIVDDIKISKANIQNQLDHELQMAKNMFGDNLDINENMKAAMLQSIIQKELVNAVIQATANDLGVSISDDYIKKIIFSQAEFLDADGRFSADKFRRLLSASGWSENKYIKSLKEDVIKQHLIHSMIENVNIPKFMVPYFEKIYNQRKVFKYITINTDKLPIDRKISSEELEQYYQDFAPQFMEPEKRDASFVVLKIEDMVANMQPDEEEIKAYYEENIAQFATPEKRNILQMAFDNEEDALKAMEKLKSGQDFYAVAKKIAKQTPKETELGMVAKDQLIADMSEKMFEIKKGEIAGPVKSEMGWHIMKVVGIKAKSEMPKDLARQQIIKNIRKEKAYDEAYNKIAEIEDKIGAGATLEEIAKENKAKINQVTQVDDQGFAKNMPQNYKELLKSNDFIETIFSYNAGEISQAVEDNNGFVIVRVDNIVDTHPKNIAEVTPQIKKLWAENERSAIAQEIINDVNHDLENGDKIEDVAGRFKLNLKVTKPLKIDETFANLNKLQMTELFKEKINSPKIYSMNNKHIIAMNTKTIHSAKRASSEELNALRMKIISDVAQEMATQLVNAYSYDHKVEVDYKNAGLDDI